MQLEAKQEITADWQAHFEVPNHLYIFNKETGKCVGYTVAGTGEQRICPTPIKIDPARRKFKRVPVPAFYEAHFNE
jgi:hypothetical protein